jgi:type IV secretory pathway VirB2 component (pilin)
MKKLIMSLMIVFVFLLMPIVLADSASLDASLSSEDQAQFDSILEPVMKIYNFIKYIASVVAVIFLLYAGISYMTSGNDPRKRDSSKNIAMYVIIGLLIIWAAPMIVNLLI